MSLPDRFFSAIKAFRVAFFALGAAVLMQAGGLSMAMGAFLAGVLLSESSFRHQLEADVEPFRGLLLGLFFLGVGMALDLNIITANWAVIAISVPAFMTLKMAVIYGVARLLKADNREAIERTVLMAQGGEFAFVLYATATQFGILTAEWNANLTAIIIISMVLTPLMIILHDRLLPKTAQSMEGVEVADNLSGNVLLIGFGRFGQIVSQPLLSRGHSISIIETSTEAIRNAEDFGFKVYYGDGSRLDILHAAGAEHAKAIVIAVNDAKAANAIAELARHEFPLVPVLARSFDREHAIELINAGVDYQVRETFESALKFGQAVLEELGLPYTLEYKRGDLRGSMAQIRALNPLMPVAPTVLYGDQVIVESGAILEMLLARHGEGQLRPAVDSPDFPYYLQWMHYSEGSFAARVIGDYRVEMIRRSTNPSPLVDAEDTIRFAEDYLSRHPYFGGAEFSAADIMMLFPLNVATSTKIADISQFPHLAAWREKIEQRPAYQRMLAVARPNGVIGSLPPLPGR